ncbi:MAG: hypothetical protein EOM20_09055 [Spartobacteria bacterium]|nr:hypothetical protein [Spartobacteria bacterium]
MSIAISQQCDARRKPSRVPHGRSPSTCRRDGPLYITGGLVEVRRKEERLYRNLFRIEQQRRRWDLVDCMGLAATLIIVGAITYIVATELLSKI